MFRDCSLVDIINVPFFIFKNRAPFRAVLGVFICSLIHILTRKIDKRMRNDISGFIQSRGHYSLPPYNLICMVAEIVLLISILTPYLPLQNVPLFINLIHFNHSCITIYYFGPSLSTSQRPKDAIQLLFRANHVFILKQIIL